MYSYEDRIKAVEMYIRSNLSAANGEGVGVSKQKNVILMVKEYREASGLRRRYTKRLEYASAQKKTAVNYYLKNGRSIGRTIKAVEYHSKTLLKGWNVEMVHMELKVRKKPTTVVQFSQERK